MFDACGADDSLPFLPNSWRNFHARLDKNCSGKSSVLSTYNRVVASPSVASKSLLHWYPLCNCDTHQGVIYHQVDS
jgi:hypothetical protein